MSTQVIKGEKGYIRIIYDDPFCSQGQNVQKPNGFLFISQLPISSKLDLEFGKQKSSSRSFGHSLVENTGFEPVAS